MEIIRQTPPPLPEPPYRKDASIRRSYLGIVLILAGVVWLLYNFDRLEYRIFDMFFSWQTLMIVLGGYLLAIRKWIGGGIVLALGVVFLLTDFFGIHIPIGKVVLPVLVIAAGISVLLTRR